MKRTITVPPYGVKVTFTDKPKTYGVLRDTEAPVGAAGMCGHDGYGNFVVGVFDRKPSTLVHECVHASIMILGMVGIDVRNDNGEAMAYLTDWLWSSGQCLCDANTEPTAGQ
ncbi:hypothetical protein KZJ38_07595 [Paraburkholderia edwinii]|uniref:Uncharacterized protein n=1 Tax=Paraburkholderia edwinii TaxID=2861782 RepID=A0ABX8USF6_9BURK|nr:hypothetical protein [Paraburkholderia edwinii]QYD70160.1 hypothetical protein KZJ38_07595 [Paraburkholderia edwinii]